ncbi:MAG: DUF5069 domain-containing protein [Opitutaceae bacterium]|jgi:hypothetical protein|nr:DUF5069 domain-containing protein [Opitutaceae bacterium]
MSERPKLRRPWDQDVADCMWLARLTDKVRLHLTGNLNEDFEPFFGHRLATDGAFIDFFEIELKDLIAVVQSEPTNDQAVTTWFLQQPGATPDQIKTWNDEAFDLGKTGKPMARAFSWARRKYYGGTNADPGVVSVFSGIAWDEGYLDEMPDSV